jgi:hypothetical protein
MRSGRILGHFFKNGSSMPIKVKEAQYGIALRGFTLEELDTANLQTCAAFAGINHDKGVGFLCHLNSPTSASQLLPEIVKDLEQAGLSLDDFQLYTASGLVPWLWIFIFAGVPAASLQQILPFCTVTVSFWTVYPFGACCVAVYFFAKRIGLSFALWRLDASTIGRKFIGYAYYGSVLGRRRGRVSINVNEYAKEEPEITPYNSQKSDRTYSPPSNKEEKRALGSATSKQLAAFAGDAANSTAVV